MHWTVGRRVAVGFCAILLLLVVVAGVGFFALSGTIDAFEVVIPFVAAVGARQLADCHVAGRLRPISARPACREPKD